MPQALFAALFAALTLWPAAALAQSYELVMVEERGCAWCARWDEEIGPIYPKTAESVFAPLRRIDLNEPRPDDLTFARPVSFTPTFVLVEDGEELDRIEGYPGEDFFWMLLDKLLKEHTNFKGETP
jgi:thioredoxin-related protein